MARMLLGPVLAGALSILLPVPARAQETLTVDQAVQQALTHNALLRAATAEVAQSDARVTEARSGWFPRVSVAETWQRGNEPVFVFGSLLSSRRFAAANFAIDALNHPDPTGFFRASFGVDQIVFDGGRQKAAVASAAAQRDISRLEVDETRARLEQSTIEAYGRVLSADAGGRAAEAVLQAARQDRIRAGNRRDAGMATDADVLALDAYVADLEQQRIRHNGDAAVARAELNRLTGAPIERTYTVVQPPDDSADASSMGSLDALFAEADANRPEVQRAAAAGRFARASRTQARAAVIPHVAAQAAFDASGTSFNDRASAWIVGAEVRWSLSLGGAERAQMQAAAAGEARATAEADDVRAGVHVEVVTAVRDRESAVARLAAGRAAVFQARESERIVRNRFESGLAGVTDLLRASSAALEADALHTSASVEALVSTVRLKRALGRHP